MSKIDVVRKAMMDALKAGDKPRKEALSLLLSALKAKNIDKRADLTEDEENAVVYKEIKEAQETLDTTPADRTEILDECRLRIRAQADGRERDSRLHPRDPGRTGPGRPHRQGQGQADEGAHAQTRRQGGGPPGQSDRGRISEVNPAGIYVRFFVDKPIK